VRTVAPASEFVPTNSRRCGEEDSDIMTDDFQVWRRNLPHFRQRGATYFITFRLTASELTLAERQIVLDACLFWRDRGWDLEAVVVMPDHVHVLAKLLDEGLNKRDPSAGLSRIMHSIKSYTAHRIARLRDHGGPIWLDEHFDRIVRNVAEFDQKLQYMATNPEKAGLCRNYLDYPFFWYPGRDGSPHRRDAGATSEKSL
jgi:putative transposase